MATARPVLCPSCGAPNKGVQRSADGIPKTIPELKNGYCSQCGMNLYVLKKAYNTSNYYYNLAYDKACARDLSGAVDFLLLSLRYNKKNVRSRNLIGLIYYEMGEVVKALAHWIMSANYKPEKNLAVRYLKALRKDPERLDRIARKFNMALAYAESENYDLAIMQLKSAISDNPHFVQGYLLLSLLYIHAGNYEKARVALRRVLKIDKANPLALHYLREMGTSDEIIIRMRSESIENDGLLSDVLLSEEGREDDQLSVKKPEKKKPIFQEIKAKKNENVVRTGDYSQISLAKYSGLYVFVGLVLGVLLFYFIVMPGQTRKQKSENESMVKSYSEELSDKNAKISEQESEIERLKGELENKELAIATAGDAAMPDYSDVRGGMSDEDLEKMVETE